MTTTVWRLTVVASVLAVACSDSPLKPCKRGAVFEVRVVDNDSAYMKNLFAHVGSDRHSDPTDPVAQQAGIRADVDQWKHDTVTADGLPTDMKTYTDYYLYAFDRSALEQYLAAMEPPPADREIRLEHIVPLPDAKDPRPSWRTYLVEKAPMLTTDAIGRATAGTTPASGSIADGPIVLLELTPAGRDAFAKGTATTAGRKVATVLDGEIVNAPIVQEKITGGRLSLRMDSVALANQTAAKLACVK